MANHLLQYILLRVGIYRITGTYRATGYYGTGSKNCPKFLPTLENNRLAFFLFVE
ncbi:MAG: hypothetical protein LBC20_14095 [Planctomycetaceae bacterium]|nr:hypothetical protein [Planctomycetaceae bacterium]